MRPAGSLVEFEVLYRAEVGAVTAFFARREREPETVADLTADTFMQAMRSLGTFDGSRGGRRAWLFGIARHVHARHCEQMAHDSDAAERDASRRVPPQDVLDDLLERIDAEQPGRELLDRMTDLSQADREAIELVDLAGLSPKEAAAAMGVSAGALRIRLFRARSRLRGKDTHDG